MEITGYDNVLYSNVSFHDIIDRFETVLRGYWPDFICLDDQEEYDKSRYMDRQDRFYGKDQGMFDLHDEHGYNSLTNGEGCLYLSAVKVPQHDLLIEVRKEITPKPEFQGPDPYESSVILQSSWQYTLVTPDDITEEGFSKEVYDGLIQALKF